MVTLSVAVFSYSQFAMTAWFRLARDALRFRRAALRIDIAILARAIDDWFHLSRKALRFQRAACG